MDGWTYGWMGRDGWMDDRCDRGIDRWIDR